MAEILSPHSAVPHADYTDNFDAKTVSKTNAHFNPTIQALFNAILNTETLKINIKWPAGVRLDRMCKKSQTQ